MKKVKVLVVLVLFCAMGYIGHNTYKKIIMTEADEFMKANIEALTSNESGYGEYPSGYDYPNGYRYPVLCHKKIGAYKTCSEEVVLCPAGGVGCNPKACPIHG